MEVKTETPEEKEALDMIDNTPAQFVELSSPTGNELLNTLNWFKQAIPNPTDEQKCIQIGCHLEEVEEMLDEINLGGSIAQKEVLIESQSFKNASDYYINKVQDIQDDRLLDAMIDQIVTAVGVCHMMGFDIMSALAEVNRSNYSKFENGQPVFDENGKITRGKNYTKPNLTRMVGK